MRARELAVDRGGGVRVVAEVDGGQHTLLEAARRAQRPQRGLERVDHIAAAAHRGRLRVEVAAARTLGCSEASTGGGRRGEAPIAGAGDESSAGGGWSGEAPIVGAGDESCAGGGSPSSAASRSRAK